MIQTELHFAIVNASNTVEFIYTTLSSAMIEFNELAIESGYSIKPIMPANEWLSMPRDYREFINGRPAIMYRNEIYGYQTVGYVYLIESWDTLQVHSFMQETYRNLIVPDLVITSPYMTEGDLQCSSVQDLHLKLE